MMEKVFFVRFLTRCSIGVSCSHHHVIDTIIIIILQLLERLFIFLTPFVLFYCILTFKNCPNFPFLSNFGVGML